MKIVFNQISLIFTVVILNSCSQIISAKFWTKFNNDEITDSFFDHGPFGGTTVINWDSKNEKFDKNVILSFANDHNWKLTDSIDIQNGKLIDAKNNYSTELIVQNNNFEKDFRNSTIYLFQTSMIAVKPGNTTETQINGFLILNADKTKLRLFHQWGE